MYNPLGVSGRPLGATALVPLSIEVEETGTSELIPCYALNSSKPIWQGEVRNCNVILETNTLISLGFTVTHVDGIVVSPVESVTETNQPIKSQLQCFVLLYYSHYDLAHTKQKQQN